MELNLKHFAAGFCLTAILIFAICGFMVVDLSTERYMPGRFGPLLLITDISHQGVELSLFGEDYLISSAPAATAATFAEPYQAMLPPHIQAAQSLGGWLHQLMNPGEEAVEDTALWLLEEW